MLRKLLKPLYKRNALNINCDGLGIQLRVGSEDFCQYFSLVLTKEVIYRRTLQTIKDDNDEINQTEPHKARVFDRN